MRMITGGGTVLKIICSLVLLCAFILPEMPFAQDGKDQFIIRKIQLQHCKKGPDRCDKCKAMCARKYCLLNISPRGVMQRPVIEVEIKGQKEWREYDIEKIFESRAEAEHYAKENRITNVKWEDDEMPWRRQDDQALRKVEGSLPAGWVMYTEGDRLIIKRREPVWILTENRINAPVSSESSNERDDRIRKKGSKSDARLVFRMEKAWTPEKLRCAAITNETVKADLKALPGRLGVEKLMDESLSRKGEAVYKGRTDDEKKRIAAFYKERENIEKKLVKLPDYTSKQYSLFILLKEGAEDDFHRVFPGQASEEIYTVESLLRKYCP
ncbi:MAG: hypothetical protein AB2L14_17985 [Candidatus Xenobiia bacterium LiM19]